MHLRSRLARVRSRLDLGVLGRIAQSAFAAGAAWEIALQIPGHGRPFFAPIAAVISLGAERGRRGRQALQMMSGVSLGILIGAALVAVAGTGAWQLVIGTALALVLGTASGVPPLVRMQATASTVLVVALHQPGSNLAIQRLVDAVIGGGIAIVLAQLLFPVDPLELVRVEASALRTRLADALMTVAEALAAGDRSQAEAALSRIDGVDERGLEDALSLARDVARRAPRRRPLRRQLEALGLSWYELDASVSDARAIATGAIRLLGEPSPSAPLAADAVRAAAVAVRAVDPAESRDAAAAAGEAAQRLRDAGPSLGASVLAHGVVEIAEHARRAADAREEARRIAAEGRNRIASFRVVRRR